MNIPTSREILDLQMMVEGYRAAAQRFEAALDDAKWQLRGMEKLAIQQDQKIQNLHKVIGELEAELIARDRREVA